MILGVCKQIVNIIYFAILCITIGGVEDMKITLPQKEGTVKEFDIKEL
ncbi:hypothetical protein HYI07_04430 [Clostridium botulinum]|uniref:Uncharacterized protein n=1 Tax=Clostridium botulinum (strain Okra / Type B1) TaxID=498213 RepID=B1IFR4_CLOBK|nr:hypothetical protein [Clostridium botulinum]ACA45944.1 hypothetical protein CLD_2551 [Clostridium botulinum B1 str. Okra]MBD5562985.1 hypothetical protein [Clostridium botulinum]MBD5566486.1 hypothetical protein [Clostridium botulinum]MBD5568998.1 hypothetical protein [Clostridium botulinum]MBD5572736.1 hypothetical protein [Clostridium botulinum]